MKKHAHIWKILIFDMFIIEFGPVGVFFATYYLSNFLTAALALGAASFVTLILSRIVNKRVPWFAIFSGVVTIITALATYIYSAPWVLIVTDSVFYFSFAILMALGLWRRQSVFKLFFGHIFAMQPKGWSVLEMRWFFFFLLAGISNEAVRIVLSANDWVLYKQGLVLVFLAFGLYQFRVSTLYRLPEADRFGLRQTFNEAK